MKPSIQLSLGQHLTLTPQLQQAIRLLQLSTLELNQEIQQVLEGNPLLELDEPQDTQDTQEPPPDALYQSESTIGADTALKRDEIPEQLPVDTSWDVIYSTSSSKSGHRDDPVNYEAIHSQAINLQDHLRWQMSLTPFSEKDTAIATAIIDAIDDDGLLTSSLEEIQSNFKDHYHDDDSVDIEEIIAVLHRIQTFDPIGVGARNLGECLSVQLQHLPEDTPYLKHAKRIVSQHIELLGSHHYKQLMRITKLDESEFQQVLTLIQSLNPRPGASISDNRVEYIIPDVIAKKEKNRWLVELNPETIPKLRINGQYSALIKPRAANNPDNTFIKNHLNEARWFIKSLNSRHDTLLKVASKIVEKQQGFLDHGDEAMKPLVLNDIASELELHESTVSRVTTQKYIHTPRGVFELKYFFSSHVTTRAGGECSSTAVRALIKKLIAAENTQKPMSDNKIANLLKAQGINIARRTIAKYREAMQIRPSNERKRLSNKH